MALKGVTGRTECSTIHPSPIAGAVDRVGEVVLTFPTRCRSNGNRHGSPARIDAEPVPIRAPATDDRA